MSDDLAKSATIAVIKRAVAAAQAVQPIPRGLVWLAVAVIAAIVFALERVDWLKLLKAWADSTRPGFDPPPQAPPITVPGPGDLWTRNEP